MKLHIKTLYLEPNAHYVINVVSCELFMAVNSFSLHILDCET
jgi:hypothetical protein